MVWCGFVEEAIGTHRDKDEISFPECRVYVCRKEQIFSSAWLNHFFQSWLKSEEMGGFVIEYVVNKKKTTHIYDNMWPTNSSHDDVIVWG